MKGISRLSAITTSHILASCKRRTRTAPEQPALTIDCLFSVAFYGIVADVASFMEEHESALQRDVRKPNSNLVSLLCGDAAVLHFSDSATSGAVRTKTAETSDRAVHDSARAI